MTYPQIPARPVESFRDLVVWQKAHALALAVYRLSDAFPRKELYGLTAQVRRAAVSIPANLAEGFRRRSRADKARFVTISEGSLEEVRYYFILAHDLKYGASIEAQDLLTAVSQLLVKYRESILARPS